MRITTDEIVKIKEYLFENGIILTHDDTKSIHAELNIPDIRIMSYLKTLVSKGYINKTFAWQHGYYALTEEGVQFLRDDLCMGDTDMPRTHEMVTTEVYETDVKEQTSN